MKKIFSILLVCILIAMSFTALADGTTECLHEDMEVAGLTSEKYENAGAAYHRVLTRQKAYCTNPSCNYSNMVTISSRTEAHTWVNSRDQHISDAKHVYYQTCEPCGAETSYMKPCGGIHPVIMQ